MYSPDIFSILYIRKLFIIKQNNFRKGKLVQNFANSYIECPTSPKYVFALKLSKQCLYSFVLMVSWCN